MSTPYEVTQKDIHDLLHIFEKKSFEAGSCEEGTLEDEITKKCEYLFKKDYTLIDLDNTNGVLSARYPARIFIPEYEHGLMAPTISPNNGSIFSQTTTNAARQNSIINKNFRQYAASSSSTTPTCSSSSRTATTNSNIVTFANSTTQQIQLPQLPQQSQYTNPQSTNTTTSTIYEDLYDVNKIRELITMAKYARCRQRFAVPVIMYRGKYICRSATISINAETYGRKVVDYAYDCLNGTNYSDRSGQTVDDENNDNSADSLMNHALNEPSPFSYDEVIKSDIHLLNAMNVTTIVDLMVEKRKIKYFMAVSSSEKADPDNHYEKFNILSLPYPGCEFFKEFRDNNYMARNLHYDWNQSFNDADIYVPTTGITAELNINWNEYKSWDLVLITQNYLKACLKYIQEEKSGLLIHCISGWDRTPLFISLIRLSLWADGLIHQSLCAMQMTYFTLAYDWFLFGHQLPNRLRKGEDIMFFCFHLIKYLCDEEFCMVERRKRTKTSSSSGGSANLLNRSDGSEEEPKDDDQDSNESISNCSIIDTAITDNCNATTATATAQGSCNNPMGSNPLTNRSPNPKRSKTSPITVPGASATRQRKESSSSNESWQHVSETGSLDSMMNGSIPNNGGATTNSKDSLPPHISNSRKRRLNAVRAIFIQSYGKTVGLKFKEGSAMNIATFIGTITEQLF